MNRLAVLVMLFSAAVWADEKRMTLHYASGKKRSVTLKAFDQEGLDVVYGDNDLRVLYKELTPESAYKARKELTPYADGPAIEELAEFAVTLQLYPEALEQLEIALALGALDEAAYEKREGEIKALEVKFLCRRIDTLIKTGQEPKVCLDAIKRLKERYPEHPNNKTYAPHIDRLVKIIAREMQAQQDAETHKQESKELARLRQQIEKLQARKAKAIAKGDQLMEESKPAIEKRQVARVKRTLVTPSGAEKYYKLARKYLREIPKVDKHFRIANKAALLKEYESLEKKMVECYLRVARILIKERNYKGSIKYVRNILFYDPINEEALDMVEEIKANRIAFKASDITNARPRVTSGG